MQNVYSIEHLVSLKSAQPILTVLKRNNNTVQNYYSTITSGLCSTKLFIIVHIVSVSLNLLCSPHELSCTVSTLFSVACIFPLSKVLWKTAEISKP